MDLPRQHWFNSERIIAREKLTEFSVTERQIKNEPAGTVERTGLYKFHYGLDTRKLRQITCQLRRLGDIVRYTRPFGFVYNLKAKMVTYKIFLLKMFLRTCLIKFLLFDFTVRTIFSILHRGGKVVLYGLVSIALDL